MCKHQMVKVNDLKVCVKCGLTQAEGKIFIDRDIPKFAKRKNERRKKP